MRDGVLFGVERRRRWPDALKLEILGEVGRDGWTVADVARRHDVTRQHIYQWRHQMRGKGFWPVDAAPTFLPMEFETQAGSDTTASVTAPEVTVVLRNGRQLRCSDGIDDATLARLVRVLEAA